VQIRAKRHRPERNELDLKYRVTLTIEIIFVRLATHLRFYVGTLHCCWNIQAIQRFCVLRTPARIHRDSITIRCTEYTIYLINLYLVTLYTLCSYFLEPHTLVPDPPQPTTVKFKYDSSKAKINQIVIILT
jgi:hypothetical protein